MVEKSSSCICSLKEKEFKKGSTATIYNSKESNCVLKMFDQGNKEKNFKKEIASHIWLNNIYNSNPKKYSFLKYVALCSKSCDKHFSLLLPKMNGELEDLIVEGKASPEEFAKIAFKLCYILENLHSIGFSHGDFKAKNILLLGSSPMICDFGESQIFDTKESHLSRRKRFKEGEDPVEIDTKQLLWIVFQLRLRIPFKSLIKKDDDIHHLCYFFGGDKFDSMVEEMVETKNGYKIKDVKELICQLFCEQNMENFKRSSTRVSSKHLSRISAFAEKISTYHKKVSKLTKEMYLMNEIRDECRLINNFILNFFVTCLKLTLSSSSEERNVIAVQEEDYSSFIEHFLKNIQSIKDYVKGITVKDIKTIIEKKLGRIEDFEKEIKSSIANLRKLGEVNL